MADLELQDEKYDAPSMLLPCVSCNRTFRPEALAKHSKVCEKSLMKKRKKFDSSKQRIQGTELAEYLPILPTFTKKVDKSPVRKVQAQSSTSSHSSASKTSLTSPKSKWREKHNELVQVIKQARLPPGQQPTTPIRPSDQEQCPYCERSFGPKAYDRHLEWCKEQRTRIQPKSPASRRAKERLEARTKYRAPLTNKVKQRSASRDKYVSSIRDPSPLPQRTSQPPPLTPASTRKRLPATVVSDSQNTPNVNQSFVKGTPLRSSTRTTTSEKKTSQNLHEPEPYDPYKSAAQQLLDLDPENDPPKSAPKSVTPTLVSSPTSAFTKFSTVTTPEPLFISEDDIYNSSFKEKPKSRRSSERSDSSFKAISPIINNNYSSSKDSNQNALNLSTLSLCSSISIESVNSNKNGYRVGISSSAKVPEKKTPEPLRRTVSALESRKARDPFKGKLKMEDLLYGSGIDNRGERYFGSPIITSNIEKDSDDRSSSGSLHKALSDAETLNAEQELLKSVSEFEKLLTSSSSSPSPSSPSSKLFPSLFPSYHAEGEDKHENEEKQRPGFQFNPDSAYSSLNRKSPVGGEQEDCSESCGVARFCHECGSKYPVIAAKFCCQCGVRRLII